jgi:Right handed beta helix region
LLFELLEDRWLMSSTQSGATPLAATSVQSTTPHTYYVSPNGSDSSNGISPSSSLKTIAAVNKVKLDPGDKVLFLGGATFSGNLVIGPSDAGTPTQPIVLGSYGTGRATISAGNGQGIYIHDTAGLSISNLNIRGTTGSSSANSLCGIGLFNDLPGKVQLNHVFIDHCDISGFSLAGIGIGSSTLTGGFANVKIVYCTLHDNGEAGIFSYAGDYWANPAPYGLAHSNIYIGHCTVYHNLGIIGKIDTGNGIELGDVNGAVIERCVAFDNGANNHSTLGGAVGIWAFNAVNVLIQYNESYGNTSLHFDGDGFDLDGGCTNCTVQYNYSHDNAGAGFLMTQFPKATPNNNDVIRFNISQNDSRKNGYGVIQLSASSSTDTINNAQIYNNTIYLTKPTSGMAYALYIKEPTINVQIRNNIFDVAPGVQTVNVKSAGKGLLFQGNDYWTGSSAINVNWAGKTYKTLGSWSSATGQEKVGSTSTGYAVNPGLQNPGGGKTLNSGDLLNTLTAYELLSNSPLIGTGVNLFSLGVNPGPNDFFGYKIVTGTKLNVGVDDHKPTS